MNSSANALGGDVLVHTFDEARVIDTAFSYEQEDNSDKGTDIISEHENKKKMRGKTGLSLPLLPLNN